MERAHAFEGITNHFNNVCLFNFCGYTHNYSYGSSLVVVVVVVV